MDSLYNDLIKKLHDGDIISVKKDVFVDEVEDRHVRGLIVFCPSLLKEEKTNYIKGLVGDGARVTYLNNQEEIYIEI